MQKPIPRYGTGLKLLAEEEGLPSPIPVWEALHPGELVTVCFEAEETPEGNIN